MSSPPFPVSAILFLLLCIWRIAFLLSITAQQLILWLRLIFYALSIIPIFWPKCSLLYIRSTNYPHSEFWFVAESLGIYQMFIWNKKPMRNTDLVLYPTDNVGISSKQKVKLFLFAGIGFVLVGIISILLISMLMNWFNPIWFYRLTEAASLGLSAIIFESCYCFY